MPGTGKRSDFQFRRRIRCRQQCLGRGKPGSGLPLSLRIAHIDMSVVQCEFRQVGGVVPVVSLLRGCWRKPFPIRRSYQRSVPASRGYVSSPSSCRRPERQLSRRRCSSPLPGRLLWTEARSTLIALGLFPLLERIHLPAGCFGSSCDGGSALQGDIARIAVGAVCVRAASGHRISPFVNSTEADFPSLVVTLRFRALIP